MARRYKRDSKGRFAATGGAAGGGSVRGTIAKLPAKRAQRLQSGRGGSGFGEGVNMPNRVGRARDAVVAKKFKLEDFGGDRTKMSAAIRRFEKKQGWRGSKFSGTPATFSAKTGRTTGNPVRRIKPV